MTAALSWTPEEATRRLVSWHGLARRAPGGPEGCRALLLRARMVQLDPLAPIASSPDLVALARLRGVERGDLHRHTLGAYAFEHFAKERCLLPAEVFPAVRAARRATSWWGDDVRASRVDEGLVAEVLAEVAARGPVAVGALSDRGRVEPLDWSGWKGTRRATTMAVELLWRRCDVVVCGKQGKDRLVDLPERALGAVATQAPPEDPAAALLMDRVAAAGLLDRRHGPWWSSLGDVRTSDLPDALVHAGALVDVRVAGWRRPLLATPAFVAHEVVEPDDDMRLLGPLDALLWDWELVAALFGFTYVWEVYKPAAQRRWGWYVSPLLHRGRLVGRLEGRRGAQGIEVLSSWEETPGAVDPAALRSLLDELGAVG